MYKRIVLQVFLGIVFLASIKVMAGPLPTGVYNVKLSAPTPTSLKISFSDSNTYAPDSLRIIKLVGADTTVIEYITPITMRADTIDGLTPHTSYIFGIMVVRGDTAKISNYDTLYTSWPLIEAAGKQANIPMWGARSWNVYGVGGTAVTYDSLYITDSTGLDSTMVYHLQGWDKVSLQVKMIAPDADSAWTYFYVYAGESRATNPLNYGVETDDTQSFWNYNSAASDSFMLTANGWTTPIPLTLPESPHFYVRAVGLKDNGYTTKAIIRLYRSKN